MNFRSRIRKEIKKAQHAASQSQSARARHGRRPSAKTKNLQKRVAALKKVLRRF